MVPQKILLGIIIGAGLFSIGISYATMTQAPGTDGTDFFTAFGGIHNGKSIGWDDNATSIARTDTTGTTSGGFLNERGFAGIVFRDSGTSAYGTGTEIARMINIGLVMAPAESFSWGNLGISLSNTDTTGTTTGSYLTERGFSGIIFSTSGTTGFGTGVEKVRITSAGNVGIGTNAPTQLLDVRGNIATTGNVTATPANELKISTTNSKDICIGTGC